MGLERVGWIVTDLVPDKDGKVKDVRNKDTHYVTAEGQLAKACDNLFWIQECIIAGRLQDSHPNPCRLASCGYYGSKFVTVIVTGKEDGTIDFRGYQVSNQVIWRCPFPENYLQARVSPYQSMEQSYQRSMPLNTVTLEKVPTISTVPISYSAKRMSMEMMSRKLADHCLLNIYWPT